eukprot:6337127-Amphidinium_carterae.1
MTLLITAHRLVTAPASCRVELVPFSNTSRRNINAAGERTVASLQAESQHITNFKEVLRLRKS